MEHVNGWCFRGIYKGGLWEDDLHVSALRAKTHKYKQGGHWLKKWAEGLQYIFEESYLVIGQ